MRYLSLIIVVLALGLLSLNLIKPKPHGNNFSLSCDLCHSAKGWMLDKEIYSYDHNTSSFPLEGLHSEVDCRLCHISLVFSEAKSECIDCHTDMHNETVGDDCSRCHTPSSWIIKDITLMHQLSRFPLLGPHSNADCFDCHLSASLLSFEPLGVDCYDCHKTDYESASSPNHITGNFSVSCDECHLMHSFTWTGAGFNHAFFPLSGGHALSDCFECHTKGSDYSDISPECYSCHQDDYSTAENPNHIAINLSTDCKQCHTTDPGWQPAVFKEHDGLYFPIYSGKHNGEWNDCSSCHQNPSDYVQFTCIDCHAHNQSDMNDEHNEVGGYVYESQACYECHPTGTAEDGFDHNNSIFPLTGAHITTACIDCHSAGYAGTPTDCYDCHNPDFNQTTNPNHTSLNIPNSCEDCHTTTPGWKPAIFDIHSTFYVLQGAHLAIASDCYACHKGDYNNTPNTCFSCHSTDYNQTTNPAHALAQFPTDCEQCHTQVAWQPSTFNHDSQYFPIYSGKHNGEWNNCTDCHTNPSNYAIFSCIDCHEHNQSDTDDEHNGVSGYVYNSLACLNCHPDGNADKSKGNMDLRKMRR